MPLACDLSLPFFDDAHREFARALEAWLDGADVRDDESDPDASVVAWARALGDAGWLHACVASRDRTFDLRRICLARERLSYRSALADFAFAMQGLGTGAIGLFGSQEQCEAFLPPVARGERLAGFALSEREAGSDVAALATTARRDGEAYVIDGEKMWISNAGIADTFVVFARTGEAGSAGLSAFVVTSQTPGFMVSERIETMSAHPLGTLLFTGCRIPLRQRIGEEGRGFAIAMATLDLFRSSVGAAALGFARRALDETLAHVRARTLFGAPLADLQMTQAAVADMATDVDAAALMVYRAAWTRDRREGRVTREAAMAKLFATESAARTCDRAVQLFGGRGVTRGEIVERLYRDVRALRIYEGASEIQRLVIARRTLAAP